MYKCDNKCNPFEKLSNIYSLKNFPFFYRIKKHLGVMRKKLNDHENGEFSCHGDLKTKELKLNVSVDMFKNEVNLTCLETLTYWCQ